MSEARLTWHRGSSLPYASLWHTLQRVAALNALRANELVDLVVLPVQPGASGLPRLANLLCNTSDTQPPLPAIPISALAVCLGEEPEAFQWSHLGDVPVGWRRLVHSGFRVCPQCLANGFHSALLSIRLLQACPIHGCGLFRHCVCGRPFSARLTPRFLRNEGYCECGRMRLFTKQTCRRPTMSVVDTQSLQPVATWIECLSQIATPDMSPRRVDAKGVPAAGWLNNLARWSYELGLDYPECFVKPPAESPGLIASSSHGGARLDPLSRRRKKHPEPRELRDRYWWSEPATDVYRAWCRHLRRHVLIGADRIARRFIEEPDPLQMARAMRSDRRAVGAFVDLVFAHSLEPAVGRRRWPYRPVDFDGSHYLPVVGVYDLGLSRTLNREQENWLRYHAAAALILSRWKSAQRAAAQAEATGLADWCLSECDDDRSWSLRFKADELEFFSLQGRSMYDLALASRDKHGRRADAVQAVKDRFTRIRARCEGPCLTWKVNQEWVVQQGALPERLRIARHRLLGIAEERPSFWLFESGCLFVARACEFQLQALGVTARDAIDALRKAIRRYRMRYPPPASSGARLMLPLNPGNDPVVEQYKALVRSTVHDQGFWRAGWTLRWRAQAFVQQLSQRLAARAVDEPIER